MKLSLDEPYKSIWRSAYVTRCADGRAIVRLYNSEEDHSSTSYARYLMSVQHGFILPSDVEVDHIDGDRSNDSLNNLRVVTKSMHRLKSSMNGDIPFASEERLTCPTCGTSFYRTKRYLNAKKLQGSADHFCSKSCSSTKVKSSDVALIRELDSQGKSTKEIAEKVKLSANTVLKYKLPK